MSVVHNLTIDEYEDKILKATRPVLIEFTADWSEESKPKDAIIDEIAPNYNDKIDIYRVDVEEDLLLNKLGLFLFRFNLPQHKLPFLVIFNTSKEACQTIRDSSKDDIINFLQENLS